MTNKEQRALAIWILVFFPITTSVLVLLGYVLLWSLR